MSQRITIINHTLKTSLTLDWVFLTSQHPTSIVLTHHTTKPMMHCNSKALETCLCLGSIFARNLSQGKLKTPSDPDSAHRGSCRCGGTNSFGASGDEGSSFCPGSTRSAGVSAPLKMPACVLQMEKSPY